MEGRPPPDLEPQNQQEEEEVLVFLLQKIELEVLCFFSCVSFNESRDSNCVKPVGNSRVPFFFRGGSIEQLNKKP